jgi:hypothetical protein
MTIWRIRIACSIPKGTYTHSEYVIFIAFPLQQRLHEGTSMSRYTYIVCHVTSVEGLKGTGGEGTEIRGREHVDVAGNTSVIPQ